MDKERFEQVKFQIRVWAENMLTPLGIEEWIDDVESFIKLAEKGLGSK